MKLTPKNWKSFQHYTDRRPAWIKLHRGLLDDFTFSRLPLASRALAPLLWLLASEYDNGEIPCTVEEIAFRLHSSDDEVTAALKPLIDKGFFIADSIVLAECKQNACLEREIQEQTEEREKDNAQARSLVQVSRETSDWPKDYREKFWERYPRKQSRKSAFKSLDRIHKSGEVTFSRLMAGIEKIPIGEPTFIPHAATWLNGARWDDEPAKPNGGPDGRQGNIQPAIAEALEFIRDLDRKPGVCSGASGGDDRLLSERGRERSEDLRISDNRDFERIS